MATGTRHAATIPTSSHGIWKYPIARLVIPAVLAAMVMSQFLATYEARGIDYYQQWLVIHARQIPGLTNIYDPNDRKAIGENARAMARQTGASRHLTEVVKVSDQLYENHLAATSTPAMPMWLGSLFSGNFEQDFKRFSLASLIIYITGLLLLGQALGFTWTAGLLIVALFTVLFEPFRFDVIDGNVNRLQAGMIGIYFWMTIRYHNRLLQILPGILCGLVVMFKPNLVMVPVLVTLGWTLQRRWMTLGLQTGGCLIGVLVSIAIPWFYWGQLKTWPAWFARIGQVQQEPFAIETGNISIARLIFEYVGLNLSAPLTIALLIIATVVMATAVMKQRRITTANSSTATLEAAIVAYAVGLGGVIPILTPQVAWPHYLLLTVPMLLVVIGNHPNPNSNQGQAPRWVPLIGILGIFVMCTGRRLLLLVSLNDYEYFSILIAFMLAGLILAASRQLLHKFSSPVASKG
mgnify:CR=1 FL=1